MCLQRCRPYDEAKAGSEIQLGARRLALTYLLARFLRFLQPHPPLIVQFHRHAAAAVGVLADPAEELLEFPPQRGVLLAALRIARAALQLLWEETGGDKGSEKMCRCSVSTGVTF